MIRKEATGKAIRRRGQGEKDGIGYVAAGDASQDGGDPIIIVIDLN